MDHRFYQSSARLAPHQEFRTASADRVTATAALRWFACETVLAIDSRQNENVAPCAPGASEFGLVVRHEQRHRQRRIAMGEHKRAAIFGHAAGDAEKIADANIDGHRNAADGTAHDDALAIDFDSPDAAVGAAIGRVEADRQRMGVEPHYAARPDGLHPADSVLTPHGFISHAGIMFPVDAQTMPEPCLNPLKKAG